MNGQSEETLEGTLQDSRAVLGADPELRDIKLFGRVQELRMCLEDLPSGNETAEYKRLDKAEDAYLREIMSRFQAQVVQHDIPSLELCAVMWRSDGADTVAFESFLEPRYGAAAASVLSHRYDNVEFWRELLASAFGSADKKNYAQQQHAYWQCELLLAEKGNARAIKSFALAVSQGMRLDKFDIPLRTVAQLLAKYVIGSMQEHTLRRKADQ